ncbi:MAG: nreC [Acidobacteria bacterium]|jgi:DNA-binding NarL/FixJ family response regulator|nr:nreC [Acidobacteriota bacterium]
MSRIRVLLADDHETVRQGLRLLIDGQPDMTVVADARNGRTAVEYVRTIAPRPDVAVLDVSMPEMNGLETSRAMLEVMPTLAIVILTRYSDDAYVQALLGAGASGYVLKQSDPLELLRAIRSAALGERYLDSALTARVAGAFMTRHARQGVQVVATITGREAEVLRLIAVGHSNKEIGAQLDISVKTVEVHKANAMRKLSLRGRIDIVRYALLQGWLQDA